MNLISKRNTKLIVIVSSIVSLSLVIFIAFSANYYLTKMSQNNTELYNAYQVSELMKSFRSNLIQQDNKLKGYQITGDGKFMEQYKLKETEIKTNLKSMELYFEGKPLEIKFEQLKELTYKKLMEGKSLGQSKQLAGFQGEAYTDVMESRTIDEIHPVIDEINSELSRSTRILLENSVDYLTVSKKFTLLEVALGILVALAGVIILFRDINVRNELETELRKAKKQAEDIAIAKEQFMANMSHEIRTPMNAILGFSNLLGKTRLNREQEEYLQAISSSGSNLLNIINDILDFSKIEAGKLSIEKISFPIDSVIRSLQIMFYPKASEKNIEFEIKREASIPGHLYGDPTRLTQILTNLINNAVKFTSTGKVTLSCELKSIEHDVANIVFRVKDTGIGIPSTKLQSIFERFDQGNKETTRVFGGTGLGLAIVKSLVEMQNGDIYVKSKEGQGSEFVVTISYPVSYETFDNTATGGKRFDPLAQGDRCVLLVEDHALNQRLAYNYLNSYGLEVEVASNGLEALDKLKTRSFDLVLMDIQMPLLDGYHTTEKLRKELGLTLPVIAMTAHILPGEKEKCMSYGMTDYISKPFKEHELYTILNLYLSRSANTNPSAKEVKTETGREQEVVVNLDDLYEMARGNQEFIREMISIFLEQNPEDIKALTLAGQQGDYNAIRAIAHGMKTSVGFMGMKPLLAPLNSIEGLAEKKESLSEIRQLIGTLALSCNKACEELKIEYNKTHVASL